jgi:hypothetical protein
MAVSKSTEVVWLGRVHLGDEPGVYGDAEYAGLHWALPTTLYRSGSGATSPVTLKVQLDRVGSFGARGHRAAVYLHRPTASGGGWEVVLLREVYFNGGTDVLLDSLDLDSQGSRVFLSIRIEADQSVPPGLYNDFLVTGLSLIPVNFEYFASVGFDYVET